ncbi:hypothetical protein CASFOL_005501 [Castilleja foliolosa]|uniref:F-box associated beta-propeller type 1 domain-containing protein n=1 Tax=Castilleja foliolosa TaxID=1961234 RepID=A0ABD3E3Y1_9LAMI
METEKMKGFLFDAAHEHFLDFEIHSTKANICHPKLKMLSNSKTSHKIDIIDFLSPSLGFFREKKAKAATFIPMGPANKGLFFKVAKSISSKLGYNNKISNNSFIPCSRYTPKPPHAHAQDQHTDGNSDNKLLFRQRYMNEDRDLHYFSMLRPDKNGLCFSPEENYSLTNHRFEKRSYPSCILGSFKGILCLEDEFQTGNVVLWNPVTDELKSLPPSSIEPSADVTYTFFSSAFGFDARSGDYKVIRCVQHRYETCDGDCCTVTHQFELYSLKNDSWRPILNPVDVEFPALCIPTNVNGSCYFNFNCDTVLSFDFADEVFSDLPLPPIPHVCFLCGIDGSTLDCIDYPMERDDRKRFDLWSWKNSECCWSKVDSFVVEGVNRPLLLWGRDKCFLEGNNLELLLFDLKTRELKSLGIKDSPPFKRPKTLVEIKLVSFVESTVSIKGQSKVGELHTEVRNKQSGSNKEGRSNNLTTSRVLC